MLMEQVELMGGQLTVSSREHHGSTFTFVLPYKVSPESDNSDDPDEFSDMDGHVVDPHDEDISSGVFIFGPRTLGSLFSSSSSSRAQNFLPNCVALNGSHKLNGFSEDPNPFTGSSMSSREVTSLEDACLAVDGACSAVDGAETPCQQETSIRQSSDSNYKVTNCSEIQSQHKENGQFHDPFMVSTCSSRVESEEASEKVRPKDSQEEVEMQERSERSSQCSSSKGQEIIRSKLKPKILLVEDNKINVMVAQSMMTRFGHNIDVVNNGVEAVRAVQSRSYDLILMVSLQEQNLFLFVINDLAVNFHDSMCYLYHKIIVGSSYVESSYCLHFTVLVSTMSIIIPYLSIFPPISFRLEPLLTCPTRFIPCLTFL